jgi:ketosteroid isomerase-like protein
MMTITREEMDRAVDDHFAFEADDDVEGVLASLGDGVEHEVIPSPFGTHGDATKIRAYYELLFSNLQGEGTTPVRRLYGDDFLVDETVWHGFIKDGRPFLCDGKSGRVSFRILHVFRFEEGKISLEQAWLDLAAIQDQLGCTVS